MPDCSAALVKVCGASRKEQMPIRAKGDTGCRLQSATWLWLQRLSMAVGLLHSVICHLLTRGAPNSVLLTLLPPQPQEVLPTWHDDIRKSQFSCNCQSPIKYHGIFSPNLFHVSTKKLQSNYKTYKNKSFFLKTQNHSSTLENTENVFFFPQRKMCKIQHFSWEKFWGRKYTLFWRDILES